jgi:hypothetical protein
VLLCKSESSYLLASVPIQCRSDFDSGTGEEVRQLGVQRLYPTPDLVNALIGSSLSLSVTFPLQQISLGDWTFENLSGYSRDMTMGFSGFIRLRIASENELLPSARLSAAREALRKELFLSRAWKELRELRFGASEPSPERENLVLADISAPGRTKGLAKRIKSTIHHRIGLRDGSRRAPGRRLQKRSKTARMSSGFPARDLCIYPGLRCMDDPRALYCT